jgi:hypothetical protein
MIVQNITTANLRLPVAIQRAVAFLLLAVLRALGIQMLAMIMKVKDVQAPVKARLAPHFDDEEELHAWLLQLPPGERAEQLAAKCQISLGKAALYIQKYCAQGMRSRQLQVCATLN